DVGHVSLPGTLGSSVVRVSLSVARGTIVRPNAPDHTPIPLLARSGPTMAWRRFRRWAKTMPAASPENATSQEEEGAHHGGSATNRPTQFGRCLALLPRLRLARCDADHHPARLQLLRFLRLDRCGLRARGRPRGGGARQARLG